MALCLGIAPQQASAQDAVGVLLNDGRYLEAIVTSLDDSQLKWRSPVGGVTQPIAYDKIDTIYFTALPEWTTAMELFENGEIEQAVAIFKPLSLDITKRTYYPAPGNFASLAKRRLLDCYRILSKPTDIAYIQEKIDWAKVPSYERDLAEIIELWAAVGNGKWQDGLKAAEKAEQAYRTTDPEMNEIGFLRGLIHKNLEQPEDAIVHFGEGYGLVTSNPRLASTSMKESANLLKDYPERETELKATLHLYAELIGKGKLWEGVAPELLTLFQRQQGSPEYKAPSGENTAPDAAKKAEAESKDPGKAAPKGKGKGKGTAKPKGKGKGKAAPKK